MIREVLLTAVVATLLSCSRPSPAVPLVSVRVVPTQSEFIVSNMSGDAAWLRIAITNASDSSIAYLQIDRSADVNVESLQDGSWNLLPERLWTMSTSTRIVAAHEIVDDSVPVRRLAGTYRMALRLISGGPSARRPNGEGEITRIPFSSIINVRESQS